MDNQPQHQRIEHTSPIWRVLAIALAAGSITALGFYAKAVDHADDFATVLVVAAAFTTKFWAKKRPDRLRRRFGPFGKIAEAIRESGDDLEKLVYHQPLRVSAAIGVGYGIGVVAAKGVVVALLTGLYSWHLAVALGAAIGAVAAAPHLFAQARQYLAGPPDEEPPEEEAEPENAEPRG